MGILKDCLYRVRGEVSTEKLVRQGMQVGKKFERLNNVLIDDSHAWLITIGDNVTLAPRVHILAHDASTKKFIGYTKIGRVTIGNNVFVGAESVILPNVKIGNNVIIGANSTVTRDIPDNVVVGGSPARILCKLEEFIEKHKMNMTKMHVYGEEYTLRKNVSMSKRMQQREEIGTVGGYVD